MTEKAFPEDEWVLTGSVNTTGPGNVSSALVYEKRFGKRNQLEFAAPFNFLRRDKRWMGRRHRRPGAWLQEKRNRQRRRPARSSASKARSVLPRVIDFTNSARESRYSKPLPLLASVSRNRALSKFKPAENFRPTPKKCRVPHSFVRRLGRPFAQNHGFGRIWTPMAEFIADRDFETGARTNWDVVPQMQVALNKRQHVRLECRRANANEQHRRKRYAADVLRVVGLTSMAVSAKAGR